MAALDSLELPAGFTTLEQIGIYTGIVAATVYPNKTYLVTSVTSEKVADTAIIRTFDGRDFFVTRFAVPLDPNYTTPNAPIWTYATENENIDVPARFKG